MKTVAELFGNFTDGQRFRSGEVEYQRWRLTMRKGAQARRISISLPDNVDLPHAQINRAATEYGESNIHQHAVAQLDGIVQSQKRNRRTPLAGSVLEHSFSAKGRLSIFANGGDWSRFNGPSRGERS